MCATVSARLSGRIQADIIKAQMISHYRLGCTNDSRRHKLFVKIRYFSCWIWLALQGVSGRGGEKSVPVLHNSRRTRILSPYFFFIQGPVKPWKCGFSLKILFRRGHYDVGNADSTVVIFLFMEGGRNLSPLFSSQYYRNSRAFKWHIMLEQVSARSWLVETPTFLGHTWRAPA